MKTSELQEKGLLDFLLAPLTLLPLAAGASVLIVAWVGILPQYSKALIFASVVLFLLGIGLWITQWLLFAEDPKLLQMREEFLKSLEAATAAERRVLSQEAERGGTPAQVERT
jgi:hypothetical protein